jgi:hypothetical protein
MLGKLSPKTPDDPADQDQAGCFCGGSIQADRPAPEKCQNRIDDHMTDAVQNRLIAPRTVNEFQFDPSSFGGCTEFFGGTGRFYTIKAIVSRPTEHIQRSCNSASIGKLGWLNRNAIARIYLWQKSFGDNTVEGLPPYKRLHIQRRIAPPIKHFQVISA